MSPTLAAPLDCAKLEIRNERAHQLGTAPSSPVTGQIYYNTGDNTLYWWDGTQWQSAKGGATATPPATTSSLGTIQLAGDLTGTATSPQIASGAIVIADLNSSLTFDSLATNRPPTASVNMNGQRIINMLDPLASNEAATKNYVDNATQGMDPKNSVIAATIANITLSGTQTINGVNVVANDRVLVKDQTTPAQNGIYVVAAGAWTRALDMDSWAEVPGATVFVEQGSTQADTAWLCTSNQGGTLGTTAITWTQFGAGTTYTAGTGITIAGNVVSQDQAYTDGRYINSSGSETLAGDLTVNKASGTALQVTGGADFIVGSGGMAYFGAGASGGFSVLGGTASWGSAPTTGNHLCNKTYVDGQDALKQDKATASGYYSTATHSAGTTVSIPQATHGLRASRGIVVQVQTEATGVVELPDVAVAASGDVTVTFGASVTANTKRFTLVG